MLKIIFIALWLVNLAFCSVYISITENYKSKYSVNLPVKDKIDYERSEVINVPVMAENQIKGYIIAQFVYVVDDNIYRDIGETAVTDYINDALLNNIYGKYTGEADIDTINLSELKTELLKEINSNFKKPYLKALLIGHFTYYSLDVVKKVMQ